MSERLIHDAAWATARSLMDCLENCLREEEKRDAFAELYRRVRAGLEAYELMMRRQERRLSPGRN